jgi:hypothetical protein
MKKVLSLVVALMLSMTAVVAIAEPSPELTQPEIVAVEGATVTPVPVDTAEFVKAFEADPVQVLGAVGAQKVAGLPLVSVSKSILQIMPGAKTVNMGIKNTIAGLKDGDKVVVALAIPGWPGDVIQAEVIDGEIVFILDEAMLIALQNIPGFDGELLFAFFKGELPAEVA